MRSAMTPAELRLWLRLRNRQLGGLRFRRQAPIGPYIVDFFCPERNLIVEVDGDQHGHESNMKRDAERTRWLQGRGHRVLRFANVEVTNDLDAVYAAISAAAGVS
jgi:very-short-patch-repair endonuclease